MPRPRLTVPSYRLHKQSGQAVVTLRCADGSRRDVLLGVYNSPESKAEYERQLALIRAGVAPDTAGDTTVNEVLVKFFKHAANHYRGADGKDTGEVTNFKAAARLVKELFGATPAAEFGPRALKAVRQAMIDRGWCRRYVTAAVSRAKRIFKWATSEELIPVAVHQALATVAGLQAGRTEARERPPVKPVNDAVVGATLPYLNRHIRGLVEFQRLTGCRPGEACALRRCDIDTGGEVWLYRPASHKTAYRGKPRVIAVGPKARELLAGFPTADPSEYVFSPARAVAEVRDERSAARKTPRYPSHMRRNAAKRKASPKRRPAERYCRDRYTAAVARGVERANRARCRNPEYGPPLPPVPHWHPNQLRHSFGTRVRKAHGLEAAQVLLGHAKADVTQVYAERDETLAAAVAAVVG